MIPHSRTAIQKASPRRVFDFLAAIAVATCLCACANVPQDGPTASNATPFLASPPKPGRGVIYIGRPFTFSTSIAALPIELDGQQIVSLGPNEYTRIELSPGKHTVSTPDTAWVRAISGIPQPADVSVESGQTYFLLPRRSAGEKSTSFIFINGMAIPQQTAAALSGFSVQRAASNAPPPDEFRQLRFVPSQKS